VGLVALGFQTKALNYPPRAPEDTDAAVT
jgi:hypothetical protein